jgi:hypothetical protein
MKTPDDNTRWQIQMATPNGIHLRALQTLLTREFVQAKT